MDHDSNPGHWSWKYGLLKYLGSIAFSVYYRKIYISGRENIPDGGKLIFAANHQNALMDALAVIMTCKYQPVYLARADIFRNPLIARILLFLKIMPVYRIRDGVEAMGQNEYTFEKTTSVLATGGCIGIMPEGGHGEQKSLRSLKKGIFRIAFRAEETCNYQLGVKIVPVGLDYSNPSGIFGKLAVTYGKPLSVAGYLDLYSRHPQKGINAMKKDLAEAMGTLMINVKDERNYDKDKLLIDTGSAVLSKRLEDRFSGSFDSFYVSRVFCRAVYDYFNKYPERADELRTKSGRLDELLRKHGISLQSLEKSGNNAIFLSMLRNILCFPFLIAGFMLHSITLIIIHLVLKKLKDPQFISSFKFVLGMVLIPVNYIFLAVLLFSYFSPLTAAALLAVTPLTGMTACGCLRSLRNLRNKMYFNRACRRDKKLAGLICGLRSEIIKDIEPVFHIAGEKIK